MKSYEQRWISVEERDPEPLTDVLVCVKQRILEPVVTIGFGGGKRWVLRDPDVKGTVTHWMPLPDAPDVREFACPVCGAVLIKRMEVNHATQNPNDPD